MIKRTTCGIGYNTGGKYKVKEHGRRTKAYSTWRNMFQRCYEPRFQIGNPTYVGCSVHEEWHNYQSFAEWFYAHKYSDVGYELDKDLLVAGNKIYSSENCCFVPRQLNALLNNNKAMRGELPQGVHLHRRNTKYVARTTIDNKRKHLGVFDTPEEAFAVYKKAKEAHVKEMADLWFGNIEPRVYSALMDWNLES